jgi:excisionase family DNA binding protein
MSDSIEAVEIRPYAYYTVEEAASLLKVSAYTIRSLITQGRLSAVRVGRQWRLLGWDLLTFGRESESGTLAFSHLAVDAFHRIWDNPEDAVYDNWRPTP